MPLPTYTETVESELHRKRPSCMEADRTQMCEGDNEFSDFPFSFSGLSVSVTLKFYQFQLLLLFFSRFFRFVLILCVFPCFFAFFLVCLVCLFFAVCTQQLIDKYNTNIALYSFISSKKECMPQVIHNTLYCSHQTLSISDNDNDNNTNT